MHVYSPKWGTSVMQSGQQGVLSRRDGRVGAEDRRFALKAATRQAHDEVEAIVASGKLLASRASYRTFCEASFAARAPIERMLDISGAIAVLPAWPRRRIADALAADIVDLCGAARDVGAPDEVPLTRPEMLGVLYVLEGSALGARLLMTSAASLGLSATFGARHLALQIAEPGAWRDFVATLNAAPLSVADERAMTAAAARTFRAFAAAYRVAVA